MEWIFAGSFGALMTIWSIVFLVRKLVRLRPLIAPFLKQLELLDGVSLQAPELAKRASALGDDPVLHVARRIELQRKARSQRRERSRRLRSRVF